MKIDNIIISGCSFVHGYDLCESIFPDTDWNVPIDKLDDNIKSFFLENRLSGRLKKHFNCEVHDQSYYGKDNNWIANSIINYIETNKSTINFENTLVLVGWTDPNRESYYLMNGVSSASITTVDHSVNLIKTRDMSDTWTKQEYDMLLALEPFKKIWNDNPSMTNKYRDIHMSIILMLQLYLEKHNIRYVMWNSLALWPKLENYTCSRMFDLSNIIDWKTFYPFKGRDGYEISWNDILYDNSSWRTSTCHPSLVGVDMFYKKLVHKIEQRY